MATRPKAKKQKPTPKKPTRRVMSRQDRLFWKRAVWVWHDCVSPHYSYGLCRFAGHLMLGLPVSTRERLRKQLHAHKPDIDLPYWWPCTPEGYEARLRVLQRLAQGQLRRRTGDI